MLAYAAAHLDEDVSLAALAGQAGLSAYHLHRAFAAVMGETPKQLTQRLRLDRAATILLLRDDSVLDVALDCGFQSHEVFCRAFLKRFGMSPSAYRERGFITDVDPQQRRHHAAIVNRVGPCVGLFHMSESENSERNEMSYSITKKELTPQPVLVVRKTVKRSEIAAAIGEVLPRVFQYAQQNGIAFAGPPLVRYIQVGPGMMTIEPGMPVAGSAGSGAGDIVAETIPGGTVATTIHTGPYEKLPEAYAAIEQWMHAEGLKGTGVPWESYLTDPGDYPDPKDWKTEVFWPLAR
ncbi:MAG TPA: helix-turn-helix domain-containing protein [Bryobacteraceae bacterium]|nr:helix-turn-helix domain-containing protein [Bryobacteraceae bacterium]